MAQRRDPITELGQSVVESIAALGDFAAFCMRTFGWMCIRRPARGTLIAAMFDVGVRSIPVIAITGLFIGMVLAEQVFTQFQSMHIESRLGAVINASLVNELGPVLAATMLAGRVGSAMAAELGTMKVTEQIDALECLGANPLHHLVAPRVLACVLLIPLLCVIADYMGVLGGALVAVRIKGVDYHFYWLHAGDSVGIWDIFVGMLKATVFGGEIALLACYRGFQAKAGAEGVGRAATEAFVLSFVCILASDFVLDLLLNGLYTIIWPVSGRSFVS